MMMGRQEERSNIDSERAAQKDAIIQILAKNGYTVEPESGDEIVK